MKLLVGTLAASLLAGDATAFVSPSPLLSRSPAPSSRTVLNESPSPEFLKEPGVVPPTGFWDPAGFCNGCDPSDPDYLRRRAVEFKHGRVCMLATIGYCIPYFFKFPGYISKSQNLKFADVPAGLDAIGAVPLAGWLQIFFFIGLLDTFILKQDPEGYPGDTGGSFWKRYDDDEVRLEKLNKELSNGRLAMLGIMALMVQDGLTDADFPFTKIVKGA